MKVLFIDNCIYSVGGVQMVISTLANFFSKKYDVDILSVLKTRDTPHFNINKKIKVFNVLDITNITKCLPKKKTILYYFLRTYEELFKKITMKKEIKKMCNTISSYDVIIFGRIETANLFFKILGNAFIQKKVIVRDSMNLKFYSKKIKNDMLLYFPKYVDYFVTSSLECINDYKLFFNDSVNAVKIYNPLGITPKKVGRMDNKTIVAVGRMDKQKGFDVLLKIFKVVTNKYKDWKLYIFGDGVNKYKLIKAIEREDLSDKVFLKGNSNDIISSLDEGSIFAFTSRYEGYANALVEAMACGLPCISFNYLTGVEEIISNSGNNGIVVNLKNRNDYFNGIDNDEDIKKYADGLIQMIDNPNLAKEYGDNATKIIKTRTVETICNEWEKIILNN